MTRTVKLSRLAPGPPSSSTEALAAQASVIVVSAYRETTHQIGQQAALELLEQIIGSAAAMLAGGSGTSPSEVLRRIAEGSGHG